MLVIIACYRFCILLVYVYVYCDPKPPFVCIHFLIILLFSVGPSSPVGPNIQITPPALPQPGISE